MFDRGVFRSPAYMSRVGKARRTTKRERKAAARGYVAPVRVPPAYPWQPSGVTIIVDEAAPYDDALDDALRGALGEFALDTREQTSKRVR